VSCAKTSEVIDNAWFEDSGGPKEPCVRWGVQIPPLEGEVLRGEERPICKVWEHYVVICAKMDEPIEMPFESWTLVGPRKHVLGGGYRLPLNHPCAATMRPVVKLL